MTKEEFLDQIVFGWIKNDLINISKINVSGNGNANFPLAMTVVIYMDHLGSYLLGTYKTMEENIREYLTCFKNPSDYPPELLNDLFRNGLAHDYFARGGISRSKMRPPMVKAAGVGVILDADSLLEDFMESLETFKVKLTQKNFEKRFLEAKETMEKRYLTHQSIIDSLPEIKIPIITYPSTFSSTATGGTQVYSETVKK